MGDYETSPKGNATVSGGAMAMGHVPHDRLVESGVSAELARYAADLNELDNQIGILLESLSPVLRHESPSKPDSAKALPRETPFANMMATYNDRLEALTSVIYTARQRIDL